METNIESSTESFNYGSEVEFASGSNILITSSSVPESNLKIVVRSLAAPKADYKTNYIVASEEIPTIEVKDTNNIANKLMLQSNAKISSNFAVKVNNTKISSTSFAINGKGSWKQFLDGYNANFKKVWENYGKMFTSKYGSADFWLTQLDDLGDSFKSLMLNTVAKALRGINHYKETDPVGVTGLDVGLNKATADSRKMFIHGCVINSAEYYEFYQDKTITGKRMAGGYSTEIKGVVSKLKCDQPDFMKNMYTAFLVINTSGTVFEHTYEMGADIINSDVASAFSSIYGSSDAYKSFADNTLDNFYGVTTNIFGVRLNGIDIPQKKQKTHDLDFLTFKIPRVESTVELSHEGEITLDLDQNLYMLDAMNIMSYNLKTLYNKKQTFYSDTIKAFNSFGTQLYSATQPSQIVNSYILNFFPLMYSLTSGYSLELEDIKNGVRPHIDLVVFVNTNYRSWTSNESDPVNLKDNLDYAIKYEDFYYTFSDVRFLGQSSSIKFSSEGANKLTASYKFIYNRLYKSYGAPMII
jgi:hypothetical protein